MVLIHIGMGHFVDIRNQESVRIQISIDRDLRLIMGQCPKVA